MTSQTGALLDVAIVVESARPEGDDRAAAFDFADGQLLVVADGAGGMSGGAEAAQAVIDHMRSLTRVREQDWVQVLRTLDAKLSSLPSVGETTAVVALVTNDKIVGASVGDSGGWMFALGGSGSTSWRTNGGNRSLAPDVQPRSVSVRSGSANGSFSARMAFSSTSTRTGSASPPWRIPLLAPRVTS